MPPGHTYTHAELILNHSPGPFYFPFLGIDLAFQAIGGLMVEKSGPISKLRSDVLGGELPFRFCAECMACDRSEHQVGYWRREHFLLGIDFCPRHPAEPLRTFPTLDGSLIFNQYLTLEETVRGAECHAAPNAIGSGLAQYLSHGVLWLLEKCRFVNGYANLIIAHRERFFASHNKLSALSVLKRDCQEIWGVRGNLVYEVIEGWFGRFFDDTALSVWTLSPVNHLLVCRALGWSIEEAMSRMPSGAANVNPLCEGQILHRESLESPTFGFESAIALGRFGDCQPASDRERKMMRGGGSYAAAVGGHLRKRRIEDTPLSADEKQERIKALHRVWEVSPVCNPFRRKGETVVKCLRSGRSSRLALSKLKRLEVSRGPAFVPESLATDSILFRVGRGRRVLGENGRALCKRKDLGRLALALSGFLCSRARLWYYCEWRPRVRLLLETAIDRNFETIWDFTPQAIAPEITHVGVELRSPTRAKRINPQN